MPPVVEDLGSLLGPGLEVDDDRGQQVAGVECDYSVDTMAVGMMLKTDVFVDIMMEEGERLFDVAIAYAQMLAVVFIER